MIESDEPAIDDAGVGVGARREDTRPAPTVMLADTLARHAPPARDLTPPVREAAAA